MLERERALTLCANFKKPEHVAVHLVFIFQLDHEPALAVPLFGLTIYFLKGNITIWQDSFKGFFFFSSYHEHYSKIRFSGIDSTQSSPGFSELNIPAFFQAAGAVFYFLTTIVICSDFLAEYTEYRILYILS